MKSEETTTPYPIDEEATECGENCSFEDGEYGVTITLHSGYMIVGMGVRELWILSGLGQ